MNDNSFKKTTSETFSKKIKANSTTRWSFDFPAQAPYHLYPLLIFHGNGIIHGVCAREWKKTLWLHYCMLYSCYTPMISRKTKYKIFSSITLADWQFLPLNQKKSIEYILNSTPFGRLKCSPECKKKKKKIALELNSVIILCSVGLSLDWYFSSAKENYLNASYIVCILLKGALKCPKTGTL